MKLNLTKQECERYINTNLSSRKIIEKINKEYNVDFKYSDFLNIVYKYGLNTKYKKPQYKDINYFNKINTKEKAYIVGFLLGDSCITSEDKLELTIKLDDIEILEFIQSELGCNINKSFNKDIKKKIYPKATIKIGHKNLVKNIKMLFGGRLKNERRIPIINEDLEKYLLLGFFDAEGCITWGKRKDRDRLWHKISFTSQLKMLEGIQKILIKNNISTVIRPKKNENCFVMEICSKSEIMKMINLLYSDNFVVLKRKKYKCNALRLELEENGEGYNK